VRCALEALYERLQKLEVACEGMLERVVLGACELILDVTGVTLEMSSQKRRFGWREVDLHRYISIDPLMHEPGRPPVRQRRPA
jgi:hypothetical protein